jgi:hypothetical protein
MTQMQTPSQTNGNFPFETVEGNLFSPVCLKSHWDATQMLRHILPQRQVALPMDFRPYVKVCKKYVTSAPPTIAPMPPSDMVFPSGGTFYPPGRYSANIDSESVLQTLHMPLDKWCHTSKWVPSPNSNMYQAGSTLPSKHVSSNADSFVSELAMPQALLRTDMHTCRTDNDTKYFERSGRLFNNPTKQDRYGSQKFYALDGGLSIGQPMPHGGVNQVPPTAEAIRSKNRTFPQPGGSLTYNDSRKSRPIKSLDTAPTNHTSFVGIATGSSVASVW